MPKVLSLRVCFRQDDIHSYLNLIDLPEISDDDEGKMSRIRQLGREASESCKKSHLCEFCTTLSHPLSFFPMQNASTRLSYHLNTMQEFK